MKLKKSFYQNEDVVAVAKMLLGKVLITEKDGIKTGGIITETEAYCESERGCHAFGGKKTERTKIMFDEGGFSYVYFCYGMHHLFNVVTGKKNKAQAVLIRAIRPTIGVDEILKRRNKTRIDKNISNGPGKVSQALGIDKQFYGAALSSSDKIWIEENKEKINPENILTAKRIGIDYAGDDAHLLWRFCLLDSAD